jgi:hypothetical protein
MTRRLRDLTLLLGSILDYRFEPETWSGQLVRKNAVRGESPSRRIPCPNCSGEGWVRRRNFSFPCERCGGQEKIVAELITYKPGRGWIEVDDYTERQVGSVRTEVIVQIRTVHCDAGCDQGVIRGGPWRGENDRCLRCGGSGRIELTLSQWQATRLRSANGERSQSSGDPRLDTMAAREAAGSYAELDLALAELHQAWPALYRLVLDVYVAKEEIRDERLLRAAGWGLDFLEARMPEPIRVPAGVREGARRREETAA